jgi:beta-lactamase class A
VIRRQVLAAGAVLAASGFVRARAAGALSLPALEARHGGRLGVTILHSGTGATLGRRGDERFPMCSTYKFLAAARVLARVDRGEEQLDRRVMFGPEALVPYAPVTSHFVGRGMALGELCAAAVTLSDNVAGNLLLESFGGPAALTGWLRTLGDHVTRLDRMEPALNEAKPGDPRDTTTPDAMAGLLRATLLGDALSPGSRAQLADWMFADKVGDARFRAGVPQGWRVADKTGSGARNTANDVGGLFPPAGAPVLVAAYYIDSRASGAERDAVLADVARIAATP